MKSRQPDFDGLFEAAATQLLVAFKRSQNATRPDEIGSPREHAFRTFLKEWLPPVYGVSHGYAINCRREMSRQTDTILFNQSTCPKFVLDPNAQSQLVPIDDIYGAIEVKSTLDEKELTDALEKGRSIRQMSFERYAPLNPEGHIETQLLRLAECKTEPTDWTYRKAQPPFYPKPEWEYFWAEILEAQPKRTTPFTMVFAYKAADNFGISETRKLLEKQEFGPDCVLILDSGILIRLGQGALERIQALQNQTVGSFYFSAVASQEHQKIIRESSPMAKSHYISLKLDDEGMRLLFFYTFLVEHLSGQRLINYSAADLLAVWRRPNKPSNE